MPLSSVQRTAVSKFREWTGVNDKLAQRYLKSTSYNVDQAVAAYYDATGGPAPSANRENGLKSQFAALKQTAEDDDEKIGAESTMGYLSSLGVNLEDASLLLALEILKAETIGEITKTGFVEGWKGVGVDGNIAAQKNYMQSQIAAMRSSPDVFKKVYRYTFVVGKEASARALELDTAITYWEILFNKPGRPWIGKGTGIDWSNLWKTYLKENYSRTVSRDMWHQTLEFATKSIEDESLSFWNDEGAWPSVIDSFVEWYRKRSPDGAAMDVDA